MKVAKKLSDINAAIAVARASIPADPYAGLSDTQRALVKAYECTTPAVEQYRDISNGTGVLSALLPGPQLPTSMSVQDLAERYERDVREMARFRKFRGIQ